MTLPPALISTEEVARRLGIDPATVRRLAALKELPAVRVGKQWRFDPARLPHPPGADDTRPPIPLPGRGTARDIRDQANEDDRKRGVKPPAPKSTRLVPDLTVKQFGALFGKSASTARLWCEQGKIEGAWKLQCREWRIPVESIDLFRQSQGAPVPQSSETHGDLSDWRKVYKRPR